MAYSASISNRNPQFILRRKAKTYYRSHSSTNTVPPLLGQVPHLDNAGSHATIDSNQDGVR